jgi:cohesin loading factor subunit SCC2
MQLIKFQWKDLAMKTIEDLWFGESHLQDTTPRINGRSVSSPLNEKSQLISKVSVIMGVSSQFRDRQSPLEELLHKVRYASLLVDNRFCSSDVPMQVIMDKDGKDSRAIHDRYAEIGNTLIDCLVDAQELPGFTVVNCIKTIYLFASAHPPIISSQQATTLLPYLKNATTVSLGLTILVL